MATQRHAIEQVCSARHIVIDEWFQETCPGGNPMVRPELNAVRRLARRGLVTELYVYRLDRLSRGTICEMLNLMNEFAAGGCRVISIGDDFPIEDGPFRELALAMLALCANFERTAIRDRIQRARERMEAAGRKWGRPAKVPEEKRLRAIDLRIEGHSVREISRRVKLPRNTVQRLTKDFRPQKTPLPEPDPPAEKPLRW